LRDKGVKNPIRGKKPLYKFNPPSKITGGGKKRFICGKSPPSKKTPYISSPGVVYNYLRDTKQSGGAPLIKKNNPPSLYNPPKNIDTQKNAPPIISYYSAGWVHQHSAGLINENIKLPRGYLLPPGGGGGGGRERVSLSSVGERGKMIISPFPERFFS